MFLKDWFGCADAQMHQIFKHLIHKNICNVAGTQHFSPNTLDFYTLLTNCFGSSNCASQLCFGSLSLLSSASFMAIQFN